MNYLHFSFLDITFLLWLQETLMSDVIQLKLPLFVILCSFTIGKHELKILKYVFKKELNMRLGLLLPKISSQFS
jgi:hypothetical protein